MEWMNLQGFQMRFEGALGTLHHFVQVSVCDHWILTQVRPKALNTHGKAMLGGINFAVICASALGLPRDVFHIQF